MAMTMTQKIIAAHAGLDEVVPGQLVVATPDLIMGNDITSPVAIKEFYEAKKTSVSDPDKIVMVMDHFVPNKDIKAAEQCSTCRSFCKDMKINAFYDVGKMGIEHVLLPDSGLVVSGELVIGADSHTCTYGALGAFSTGVGSTDMAFAMAEGKTWLKIPTAIKVVLTGSLPKYVSGKDVILHLIGQIGVDGALYKSLEFCGDGVHSLEMHDRFTICNMAIEAGAKNGIFPVDNKTLEYIYSHGLKTPTVFFADEDAQYDSTVEINLSELEPVVAFPSLPENTKKISEITEEIRIDQVVIGSCTNGRFEDLAAADEILKGKKVADGVRVIVIPATQEIYLRAIEAGFVKDFIEAGAVVSTPTCGPCLGGYMGVLAAGERAVSTTNRNFVGRMGSKDSEVYLASPAVAAASAVLGRIASPAETEGLS